MRRKAELAGGAMDPRNFSLTRQFPFENIIPGIISVQKLIGKREEKRKSKKGKNTGMIGGSKETSFEFHGNCLELEIV